MFEKGDLKKGLRSQRAELLTPGWGCKAMALCDITKGAWRVGRAEKLKDLFSFLIKFSISIVQDVLLSCLTFPECSL